MNLTIRNQRGFTLIEGIITSVLSVVIVSGLITFLYMYNDAVNEGAASILLQQQADIVYDQIGRDVRAAAQVLTPSETFSSSPPAVRTATSEIRCHDVDGMITAAYKIENGLLYESRPATPGPSVGAWEPFQVTGTTQIELTDTSDFSLAAFRSSVTVNLQMSVEYKGETYTTPIRTEIMRCRNGS